MGSVLFNIKSGDKVYIECSDINTDISKHVEKCKQEGIREKDIFVLIENNATTDESDLTLSLNEFYQTKKQLEFLTSHVKKYDTEVEKFVKIVTSLHKNIKYAHTKTGNRNVGKSQNFIDGLTKGRCVCVGMSQILREALLMHGIDCEIVESTIKDDYGHQWNKVKLEGEWYNWDQTNIKADILSLNSMGKNLKTDNQLRNRKIYQYYTGDIVCATEPSDDLIQKISYYTQKHKNKCPRRENTFSRILNRFKRPENKALPQGENGEKKDTKEMPDKNSLKIVEQELVAPFIKDNINLWRIKTWNTKDVSNKIKTMYLGLDYQDSIDKLIEDYEREFWDVFLTLSYMSKSNYEYIGTIVRADHFKNAGLIGVTPYSKKSKKILKLIDDAIQEDMESEKVIAKMGQKNSKQKEEKTH